MRFAWLLLFAPLPALAKPAIPLVPPAGLPFAPEGPRPVSGGHPFYRAITIAPPENVPAKVGGFLTPVTNAIEFGDAVRDTLAQANLLADDAGAARYRLGVRWIQLDAPRQISFASHATAMMLYTLTRVADGQVVLMRPINTSTESHGGDGAERFKGNARFALLTNLASLVVCLDKAGSGAAPDDCALHPLAHVQAPQPPMILFYRR